MVLQAPSKPRGASYRPSITVVQWTPPPAYESSPLPVLVDWLRGVAHQLTFGLGWQFL